MDYALFIKKMPETCVLVVGDIMLDRFVYGTAGRLSPEAPVPVLNIDRESVMPGGAGNVLMNLSALGVRAHAVCLVGADDAAARLRDDLAERGIDVSGLVTDPSRPTPEKTRYLVGQHQLLRTDVEKTHPADAAVESELMAAIERLIGSVQAVVLSDYGKGTLTPAVIAHVMAQSKKRNVPVLVDPKGSDYARYRGAFVVTPNRAELAVAAGVPLVRSDEDIVARARRVLLESGIDNMLVTRSEDGMTLVPGEGSDVLHVKTQAREVFDVSGAGDTVVATLAAALAAGASLAAGVSLSNIAGGIAVGKVGTALVRADELLNAVQNGGASVSIAPLLSWESGEKQVKAWQASGLRVGFTNGCFDILHYGHVNYLAGARAKCDRLVVGLNHDASVRLLKGLMRPVNDENARAAVIGALSSVDAVVLFGAEQAGADNTPCALIDRLKPDIFFKGGDYTVDQLPEAKIVSAYGGKVCIMDMYAGFSTTSTLQKMKNG